MTQIVKDNAGVYWLEITPDPSVELWYVQTATGEARSFNPKDGRFKLGKDLAEPVKVTLYPADVIRRSGQEAVYPKPTDPPPSGEFGGLLPARLAASPGSEVQVNTLSELKSAFSNAPFGSKIKITSSIDLQGGEIRWGRKPTNGVITEVYGGKLTNGRLLLNGGSHIRVRDLELNGGPLENIKVEECDYVELLNLKCLDAGTMGISVQRPNSPPLKYIAMRDIYVRMTGTHGSRQNLDHCGYINSRVETGLMENIMWDGVDVNHSLQLYPHCVGWLITCNSVKGGLVLGAEQGDSFPAAKNTFVGLVVEDARHRPALDAYQQVGPDNIVYDSMWWNCPGGGFESHPNISYVHSVKADPATTAANYIPKERWGYVPAKRTTADAGYKE